MSSSVPAVLTALVNVFTAALPDLQVGRGTLLEAEPNFLIVGYDEGDNGAAVTGVRDNDDMSGASDSETFDVRHLMSVWHGDDERPGTDHAAAAVNELYGYLATLEQTLKDDKTLGLDNVEMARILGDFALQQPISGEGAVATLTFLVHVDAWTTP